MSEHAKVTSIAALEEFRAAIAVFAEEVERALMSADADIARAIRNVAHDLPSYWKSELRRREENVVKARIALEQALASREMGKSTVEERKALAKAKDGVSEARDRLEATKHWQRMLEREELIYRGRVEPLRTFLQAGAPRAANALRQMIDRLDEYVSIETASASAPDTGAGDSPVTGAGPTGAESMARAGPRRKTPDDLALLAARLPSPSQVEAAGQGLADDLPTPPLSPEERARLGALPPGAGTDARTFILVANTARRAERLAFHRASPATANDSGWRVLALDRKEPTRWTRVPVVRVLRAGSPIYDLLRLAEGWTAVLVPGERSSIRCILDPKGSDHWGSMGTEPESPT